MRGVKGPSVAYRMILVQTFGPRFVISLPRDAAAMERWVARLKALAPGGSA